ncbi:MULTISPECIES: hypothetical protein [unclassified Flavobacterium]|jgi:hypothetical protein|uniref:hypothetical protein n=1 Tax=unclassified Flavobacterium TaxID=196869 RepID=UPI0025C65BC8|nr:MULTISPECIES: hypothetical protein [unclassified Flavobacterium]
MKKFILFVAKILVIILVLLVMLDWVYTTVYLHSHNRGKVEYVFNSNARNYDVVILGSSRANNHFVSQMFEDRGLKTFNYGMSGAHLFEASLMLKLMAERHYKIKTVILEADLGLCNEKESEGIAAKFLPYIHHSKTIREHFSGQEDFNTLYYVPFYRYVDFDALIGFREMYQTAIHTPTNNLDYLGYHPLGHKPVNMKNDIRALKPIHNKYYEEIKQICKQNNYNLIAVMTPMCTNVKGLDYFEKANKIYPEIHNLENVVQGDQYFSSCGHLNDAGARIFTKVVIEKFFEKK